MRLKSNADDGKGEEETENNGSQNGAGARGNPTGVGHAGGDESNEGKTPVLAQSLLDFCERFMEFLIDLLCQLPTRCVKHGAISNSLIGGRYDTQTIIH